MAAKYRRRWRPRGARTTGIVIALGCAAVGLFFVVKVVIGRDGGSDSPEPSSQAPADGSRSSVPWVSTHERVLKHEALPCTGPKEPINFETVTAGPTVAGLPLAESSRRCDPGATAEHVISNEISYIYGSCKIPEGVSGCQPPLTIQTWPACQRSLADYSYEGKPIPYRELPKLGDAEVVEIELPFEHRIEVYTKSITVVIFATSAKLAESALTQLRSRPAGLPPAVQASELRGEPANSLEAPVDGAVEGDLPCHT